MTAPQTPQTDHDPFDPPLDASAPLWQRVIKRPIVVLALAAVAFAVGVWLSGNASRAEAAREALPPRVDCVRFPGACGSDSLAPPPELAALAAEVDAADVTWRETLERERRTGVFPEKGLVATREALAITVAAVRDARTLLASAETAGDAEARAEALDALRSAYDARRALLKRATRLVEQAV